MLATQPGASYLWSYFLRFLPYMEKLFGNSYANIFLHRTSHNTLELQWLDFVPSAELRIVLPELMRLARHYQAKALIADNRLLRAMRQADLEYSGEIVLKGFSDLGATRFAPLESLDAMNRMGVSALIASVIPNTNLTSHYFTSIEKARAWATSPL